MGDEGESSGSKTLISKLDVSDPLYLHPSDSSSLSIINVKLNDDEVLASQWDRCNSVVLTWILNSVCDELYVGQVYSESAFDVWEEPRDTYDKVDGLVIFGLYQKIGLLSQNGSSVSEYYHKLTTMWKQFDAMLQLPSCSCQASKSFNDFNTLIKLMQFLIGLDDVYQPVRTNLLTREPLPTVKTAFSIISREESHRSANGSSKTQTQKNVGFVAKANQKGIYRGPNPNLKCSHCNKIGHTLERCFEIVGYPQNSKPRFGKFNNQGEKSLQSNSNSSNSGKASTSSNSTNVSLTPNQISRLLGLLGDKNDDNYQTPNVGGLTHKRILVTSNQIDGLYLCGDATKPVKVCYNRVDQVNWWHTRLGHPAFQVLDVLKNDLKLKVQNSSNLCEVCHLAKQHREPFSLSEHKTSELGELIHLDVWGPYRVNSKEGYKSFFTVVDFTRAVWVYLLKTNNEVYLNLVSFFNMIKTQFGKTIKAFRSDNGTEFVNTQMQMFVNNNGISHQTSCIHTPQRNGIVERKHRHLLNIARFLLFESGVPLNFWSECVLTATYLINRTPSSVLDVISSRTNPDDEEREPRDTNPSEQPPSTNNHIEDGVKDQQFVENEQPNNLDSSPSEGVSSGGTNDESNSPEGNVGPIGQKNMRRSSRESRLPKNLHDYC
ncbi:uncharacterized protein LOC143623340 [Bidens hawaiensis]|uniref:uncharacterized protein LOC143623340 n=1 Tax=Bidens hawaiensis TaxID=980011 RepID=UPI00404994EA